MKRIGFDQLTAFQERLDTLQKAAENAPPELRNLLQQTLAELSVNMEEMQGIDEEKRQQTEELLAVQQSLTVERERYRDLFDFAPDGYLITDPHGVIKEANYAAANFLQIAPAFVAGKPLYLYIASADRRAFLDHLTYIQQQTILDTPSPTWEIHLKPCQGPLIPTTITVAPKYNATGKLLSLRWLLRDISAARQAEAARRTSEAFNRAILNSLDAHIAVLDQTGNIIAVNEGWKRFAISNGDQVAGRAGFKLSAQDGPNARLPKPVESAFFRIAQEALNNVVKHAQATEVHIKIDYEHEVVRMIVADNGQGFEPVCPPESNGRLMWGLMTMAERAMAVGADYRVESQPSKGT